MLVTCWRRVSDMLVFHQFGIRTNGLIVKKHWKKVGPFKYQILCLDLSVAGPDTNALIPLSPQVLAQKHCHHGFPNQPAPGSSNFTGECDRRMPCNWLLLQHGDAIFVDYTNRSAILLTILPMTPDQRAWRQQVSLWCDYLCFFLSRCIKTMCTDPSPLLKYTAHGIFSMYVAGNIFLHPTVEFDISITYLVRYVRGHTKHSSTMASDVLAIMAQTSFYYECVEVTLSWNIHFCPRFVVGTETA